MCSAGDTDVVGWNYWNVGGGDLIADCSDVAGGLSYIIDNCSSCYSDYCKVEGECLHVNALAQFANLIRNSICLKPR